MWKESLRSAIDLSKDIEDVIALVIMVTTIVMMSLIGVLFIYFTLVACSFFRAVKYNSSNMNRIVNRGRRYIFFLFLLILLAGPV